MYSCWGFEADGHKMTNDKLAKWYADHVQLAADSEPVTRTFIEIAMMTFKATRFTMNSLRNSHRGDPITLEVL